MEVRRRRVAKILLFACCWLLFDRSILRVVWVEIAGDSTSVWSFPAIVECSVVRFAFLSYSSVSPMLLRESCYCLLLLGVFIAHSFVLGLGSYWFSKYGIETEEGVWRSFFFLLSFSRFLCFECLILFLLLVVFELWIRIWNRRTGEWIFWIRTFFVLIFFYRLILLALSLCLVVSEFFLLLLFWSIWSYGFKIENWKQRKMFGEELFRFYFFSTSFSWLFGYFWVFLLLLFWFIRIYGFKIENRERGLEKNFFVWFL